MTWNTSPARINDRTRVDTTDTLIELATQLISFRTVDGNYSAQRECLHFIAEYLSDIPGLYFQQYTHNDYPSLVITTRDTKRPALLLNGHIDVVDGASEQFTPYVKNNRIFGRGALDMKGGVATIVQLFHDLASRHPEFDLGLMLTSDEEQGGRNGVGHLVRAHNWRADFVLTPEGRRDLVYVTREKGVCWVKIRAEGSAAHGAYPWLGENAIEKLMGAYQKISALFPEPADAWQSTCNLARIETYGEAINQVPAAAEAMVDIRYTDDFAHSVEDVITKLQKAVPEVDIELSVNGPVLAVPSDHPSLDQLHQAAESYYGAPVPFGFNHGASDAAHFAAHGVSAMTSGITGDYHHAPGEYVEIQSMIDYYSVMYDFARRIQQTQ